MDDSADVRRWAEEAFGTADLGDRPRTRRLGRSAAMSAAHPPTDYTHVVDWPALRGGRPAPAGETGYQRKGGWGESALWAAGFRGTGRPEPGHCWVDVADRGGDDYESMRASLAMGHQFLVRANQNRLAFVTPAHD